MLLQSRPGGGYYEQLFVPLLRLDEVLVAPLARAQFCSCRPVPRCELAHASLSLVTYRMPLLNFRIKT